MPEPEQLIFDWPVTPSHAREDFIPSSCNQKALDWVDQWPHWPAPLFLLVGPKGSGKSHLAEIWARKAHALRLTKEYLQAEKFVADLVKTSAFVLEDLDQWGASCQSPLFHLLNMGKERGVYIMMTAQTWPDTWSLTLKDLLSRLRLAPSTQITEPDADLMRAIFVKLFADRQLNVDQHVIDYLVLHMDRSIEMACEMVTRLDRESLSLGRRITRPLVVSCLKKENVRDTCDL